VDPTLKSHQLQFRPSMNKFDSVYTKLDVLNIADYIPCYLNRQVIVILASLGVPDEAFIKLQGKMLNEMSNMLIDRYTAERYLLQYYRSAFSFNEQRGGLMFDYTLEPFFRDLLKTIYQKLLQDLIQKSRIFVGTSIYTGWKIFFPVFTFKYLNYSESPVHGRYIFLKSK
jgi:RNA-dependent RNA polymerase